MKITSIKTNNNPTKLFYDITTTNNHNFFANDILTHNCNLPARNVIVVGVHRGLQEVDELDIIQMAGRAGRYGIDDEGHVYLIIPKGTTKAWQKTFKNPRPVASVLRDHRIMAFHVLAEIQNRVITNADTMLKWYSRSLAYFQKEDFTIADANGLMSDLESMEMVVKVI